MSVLQCQDRQQQKNVRNTETQEGINSHISTLGSLNTHERRQDKLEVK